MPLFAHFAAFLSDLCGQDLSPPATQISHARKRSGLTLCDPVSPVLKTLISCLHDMICKLFPGSEHLSKKEAEPPEELP